MESFGKVLSGIWDAIIGSPGILFSILGALAILLSFGGVYLFKYISSTAGAK